MTSQSWKLNFYEVNLNVLKFDFETLEPQGYTVTHLKALRDGKYDTRGLSFGSTSSIYQDLLKSDILQDKRGFVDSQSQTTVSESI